MKKMINSTKTTLALLTLMVSLGLSMACQAAPESQNATSTDEGTAGSSPIAAESATLSDEGQAAYVNNDCAQCHSVQTQDIEASVSSAQMRGPDLSQIGREHDAEWIVTYLKGEQAAGEPHRVPYRGSDADLQALAEWLAELQ